MNSLPSSGQKNDAYLVTEVERKTRCILGRQVVCERDVERMQEMVEGAPPATPDYSDAFALYERLVYYPERQGVAPGKSQTYSVEADNAELRHYLARLGRRSRCFSRSIDALRRAVKLFVYAWNRRQLHRQAFPSYAYQVMEFV